MSFSVPKLKEQIKRGTPIVASNAPSSNQFPAVPPQVPRDSWHGQDDDAKQYLPPNTVKIVVDGHNGFVTSFHPSLLLAA
jgi:hypothetical protein